MKYGTPASQFIEIDGVRLLSRESELFLDEPDAINVQVAALKALGVHAIVVTIHQGGFQTSYEGPTRAASTPAFSERAIPTLRPIASTRTRSSSAPLCAAALATPCCSSATSSS